MDVILPEGNDLESHFVRLEHIVAVCKIDEIVAKEVLEEAFAARKDEMISKYVNTRVENERRTGNQPNAGAISVECMAALTGPGSTAIHGKTLVKGVRDSLRMRGIADHLISNSATLKFDGLERIRNAV